VLLEESEADVGRWMLKMVARMDEGRTNLMFLMDGGTGGGIYVCEGGKKAFRRSAFVLSWLGLGACEVCWGL
jgi:hypothetical protein